MRVVAANEAGPLLLTFREEESGPRPDDDVEALTSGRAVVASAILAAAILLACMPAVIALVSMVNAAALTAADSWIQHATAGALLVSAGRIPLAIVLAYALARSHKEP